MRPRTTRDTKLDARFVVRHIAGHIVGVDAIDARTRATLLRQIEYYFSDLAFPFADQYILSRNTARVQPQGGGQTADAAAVDQDFWPTRHFCAPPEAVLGRVYARG